MNETYAFLFCLALGVFARLLFLASNALAKRTDILPITVILDILTAATVGGGFTVFIVFSGVTLAPYMFAALFSGYLFTYWVTKSKPVQNGEKKKRKKAAKTERQKAPQSAK